MGQKDSSAHRQQRLSLGSVAGAGDEEPWITPGPACRALREEIATRQIRQFRNTVVGHIRDDDLDRPLTPDEIDRRLETVLGPGGEDAFLLWINDPATNVFPNTLVAICETTRDQLREQYALTDTELWPTKPS